MNAARLLAHYDRIADAPDAIPRLRRFILDLAVRGKLVPQDAKDEPASELLKRIAQEKARLVRAGEIRKPKEPFPLEDRELPFDVPTGWKVASLDALAPRSLSDGDWIETKDQSDDGGVRLIQLADVGVGEFLNKSARYITEETEVRLNCTRLAVGDVLIARLPNPIGRACSFPDIGQPAITAVDVAILRPDTNVSGEFVVLAMNAPPIRDQIEAYGKGATRFRVSTGHLKTVQVPLPPLAEQHRIVAKVDKLMALCDRLEAAWADREAKRDRLVAASLASLAATNAARAKNYAYSVLGSLPSITARPNQIKEIRQTIFNLAVRGALSPAHSCWSMPQIVGNLASLQNGYAFKSEWFSTEGIRLVRNANVGHGRLNWEESVRLPESRAGEYERFRLSEGDVVLTLDRPFIVTGTKVARVTAADLPALLLQRVGRFVLTPRLHADYLFLWINSPHFSEQINPGRSNGVPHISSKEVEAATIFVPPVEEQHRIVAKVDALMALCDRLEASLAAAETGRSRLLNALLQDALAPAAPAEAA